MDEVGRRRQAVSWTNLWPLTLGDTFALAALCAGIVALAFAVPRKRR